MDGKPTQLQAVEGGPTTGHNGRQVQCRPDLQAARCLVAY